MWYFITQHRRFLIWIFCLISFTQLSTAYRTYYLDQYPVKQNAKIITLKDTDSKDSSVVLKASKKSFPRIGTYHLIIKPPYGQYDEELNGLIFTTQMFNLSRDRPYCSDHLNEIIEVTQGTLISQCSRAQGDMNGYFSKVCTMLTLSERDTKKALPISISIKQPTNSLIVKRIGSVKDIHYHGCLSKPDSFVIDEYQSNGQEVSIFIELDIGHSQNKLEGFEITITTLRRCGVLHVEGPRHYEFPCSNGTCIYNALKCDERQNCVNNMDESTYTCTRSLSSSRIGIIVGILIFVFILMVIASVIYRRSTPRETISVISMPTTRTAARQPTHTQPTAPCIHNDPTQMPQVWRWTNPYAQPVPDKGMLNDLPPPYDSVVNSNDRSRY